MLKKTEEHVFQGMQRDMSISKQKSEFLWDANNIRLTLRHGNTLLSMTNERGNAVIKDNKSNDIQFDGVVLGYCVLGNYLTVFTTEQSSEKPDHIYLVCKSDNGFDFKSLFNGDLGFDVDHPIECLGVYENVDIQKVYWTDGINQPRFINITKELATRMYNNTSFDFIPTLKLEDSIKVTKVPDSSGLFPAGVIQYAITYFNKYGQESNVSVISPLIPTSYDSRAGSPEETIGNAFKITINNPDKQFEFLRLYSIFRSSKDTTPVCKKVMDVRIGYGGDSSTELHVSQDKRSSSYERSTIYDIQYKKDIDHDFVNLLSSNAYLGKNDILINGVTFRKNKYYLFSKKTLPKLILKAKLFDFESGLLKDSPEYITWDSNTDILICETLSGEEGYYDIWPIDMDTKFIVASDISYTASVFLDNSVTITDNNTLGEDVDANEILFVGGEEITAGTLTQKDGTMFLGNINISRPLVTGDYETKVTDTSTPVAKELAKEEPNIVYAIRKGTHINISHRKCWFPITMNSKTYKWGNTLNAYVWDDDNNKTDESTNIAGFKWGDHYRLGLQFQYKTGKWSQPVFINDKTMENNPESEIDYRPSLNILDGENYCRQNIPIFKADIDKLIGAYMLSKGYKRVRSVVCFPTESDQLILCQGVINPTVHSIANRLNHTPDAQSSWYFRPIPSIHDYISEGSSLRFSQETEGGVVQYRHMYTINKNWESNDDNHTAHPIPSRCDEIQGMPRNLADKYARGAGSFPDLYNLSSSDGQFVNISVDTEGSSDDNLKKEIHDSKDLTNVFVVDWNYLTFHSPEFEFNDSFHNMDAASLRCKIIGKQLLTSNQGDIHITTSTGPIGKDAPGFYHRIVSTNGSAFRINAGLFYKDNRVYDDFEEGATMGGGDKANYPFLVYPWHRHGSLNNDCVRPYSENINQNRTAMLEQKKMINLMYFGTVDRKYSEDLSEKDLSEKDKPVIIKNFSSDQISLIKINGMNYFGNVDQVLSPAFKYNIGYSDNDRFTGPLKYIATVDANNTLYVSNDPVFMKYKSTPHAVIYTEVVPQNSNGDFDKRDEPYLYYAEMYRNSNDDTDFGGKTSMAIHNNLWYPAGPATPINANGDTTVEYLYGDTYYQRYDCLKTYPFTDEDTNSIIEIGSFLIETRVNLDGRYDKSRGDISNFKMNPTNFNIINPVYSQMDNFFNYRILDDDYYALNKYPTMVTWTGYKNNAAEIDSWTNITLASTLEMDGTKGKVNAVRVNSDQLYCFQDDAVGQILFNSRVQISPSDGVPIEISNNYKVDGNRYITTAIGCKNKWSIIEGVDGLYFIDDNTKALYQLGGLSQLKPISTSLNMSYWFKEQNTATPWRQSYHHGDDKITQNGIRCYYDNVNADLYICTPDTTLCYSEKLLQFVSFYDYHDVIGMFNIDSMYYALNYQLTDLYSKIKLWGMFQGEYNTFFDVVYPSDFTFISNENPANNKIFTNIETRGDFRYWINNSPQEDSNSVNHILDHNKTFDTVRVWNEYQDTGAIDLDFLKDTPSNAKKKFRVWRFDIPRDSLHKRQRISNTWTKIKFTMNNYPEYTMRDVYNYAYNEFALVSTQETLNFKDRKIGGVWHYFELSGNKVIEWHEHQYDNNIVTRMTDATYTLDKNKILRRLFDLTALPELQKPDVYAYRKIHDMEIHDIGVTYFV